MINPIVNTGFQPKLDVESNSKGAVLDTSAKQPTTATPVQKPSASSAQLSAAVIKLNDHFQNVQRNLSFSVDKDSGLTVVSVYDSQTKELITQVPSEATLQLAASINKDIAHFFVQEKA